MLLFEDSFISRTLRQIDLVKKIGLGASVLCVAHYLFPGIGKALAEGDYGDVAIRAVILAFAVYLVTGLTRLLFLIPLRHFLFSARNRQILEAVAPVLDIRLSKSWSGPWPAILALDPGRRAILACSAQTGHAGLLFGSGAIAAVKIETKRTVTTTTIHSPTIVTGDIVGGSTSESQSRIRETNWLELSCMGSDRIPHSLVFDFGEDRRAAEDWVLAIEAACSGPSSAPTGTVRLPPPLPAAPWLKGVMAIGLAVPLAVAAADIATNRMHTAAVASADHRLAISDFDEVLAKKLDERGRELGLDVSDYAAEMAEASRIAHACAAVDRATLNAAKSQGSAEAGRISFCYDRRRMIGQRHGHQLHMESFLQPDGARGTAFVFDIFFSSPGTGGPYSAEKLHIMGGIVRGSP